MRSSDCRLWNAEICDSQELSNLRKNKFQQIPFFCSLHSVFKNGVAEAKLPSHRFVNLTKVFFQNKHKRI